MKNNIKERAQKIRKMKIRELQESIEIYEKLIKTESKNYKDPERYKKICQNEIDFLNEKLKMIT